MQLIASPRRRTAAALAAGALSLSGMAVLAGSAYAADPDTVTLTPSQVDTSPTRATGHNDFQTDGVHVHTEGATSTDKAAGYFDVNIPLADVGNPSLDWTSDLPATPGLQLTTDFDNDGDVDGTLVVEPVYNGNWWVGSPVSTTFFDNNDAPKVGGGGGTYNGTLEQWLEAFPDAQVIQSGWSLGSGVHGDGVINSITLGDTEYRFSKDEDTDRVRLREDEVHTEESKPAGHNEFRAYDQGGVHVYTDDASGDAKAAGYFDVNKPFREIGEPSMVWTANGPNTLMPSIQLRLDTDNDGVWDAALVGERSYADGTKLYQSANGQTDWWLTGGSSQANKDLAPTNGGGYGSQWHGTLSEWRAALPADAVVLTSGWSLGSGVKGDGDIASITLGTTTYQFKANQAPKAKDVSRAIAAGLTRAVTLKGTDADGDVLTYAVNGKELAGNKFSYQASTHFVGTRTFTYKASDGHGGSDTGTITIDVVKAKTKAKIKVTPDLTPKKTVRVRVDLTTSGRTVGTIVRISVDGKAAGAAEVHKNYVRITLGSKLKKGSHVIRAKYVGNAWTQPVKVGTTVRVR